MTPRDRSVYLSSGSADTAGAATELRTLLGARLTDDLARGRTVLVLIGPRWLDEGRDAVLPELSAALRSGARVIPILVSGARMPAAADLPPELVALTRRQALEMPPEDFESVRFLETIDRGPTPATRSSTRWLLAGLGAVLVVSVALLAARLWPSGSASPQSTSPPTKPPYPPAQLNVLSTTELDDLTKRVAVDGGRGRVFLTHATSISVADTAHDVVTARVRVPAGLGPIAVDPTTGLGYVGEKASVAVIDSESESVVSRIPVGDGVAELVVDAPARRLYSANYLDSTVSVIDLDRRGVVATIQLPPTPSSLALDSGAGRLYVGTEAEIGDVQGSMAGSVSVIDTTALAVVDQFALKERPSALAFDPTTSRIYAGQPESGVVLVMDAESLQVHTTIDVAANPLRLEIDPARGLLLVPTYDGGSVVLIATSVNQVVQTLRFDGWPTDVDVDPEGERAYVVCEYAVYTLG